jgi:hypothetical protein
VLASFGRATHTENFDNTPDQATLDAKAAATLSSRQQVFYIPTPKVVVTREFGPDDFDDGDLIGYSFDAALGLQTFSRRVAKRQVDVDEAGVETLTVTFA